MVEGTFTLEFKTSAARLVREQGGKLTLTRKVPQEEGAPKAETVTGTYSVKGRTVEVKLPSQKPDTGALDAQGVLTFKALGAFYDFPSECDA